MKWNRPSRPPRRRLGRKATLLEDAKEFEQTLAVVMGRLRARHGTPMLEIADWTHLSHQTVSNAEKVRLGTSVNTLFRIARSHGREAHELLEMVSRLSRRSRRRG